MRPERTIVLLKQFLGDGVMTEPLLSTLADNYSHVEVLALPSVQQVLWHLESRVSFMHVEKIKTLRETMTQARKLRLKGYDVAFLVNRSFRAAMLARLAKIPIRIGHGTENRSFLLTRSVQYHAEDFEAKSYLDLARAAGLDPSRVEPELELDAIERKRGSHLASGARLAFQPGARHGYKQVPSELYERIAAAVEGPLVFVGGAEEIPAADALALKIKRPVINLVGKTSIRETMAVLASVRAAVGGDTGVMHLAAALGTPTVTLFGPTPAIKWGHHYAPHHVLQAPNQDLGQLAPDVVIAATLKALGKA